jgi:hypothetical protein
VLPGRALRLAQTLRIAGHGRGAPRLPAPLQLPEESHGVTVPRVPACQEIRGLGREETAAAIRAALARRQRRRAEGAIDGMLANPQRLGHGPPGPPRLVDAPDLLMARPPRRLAWVGQLLDPPGGRWPGHQDSPRVVGPRPRRLAAGRLDGRAGIALGVQPLREGCGEVLPQVNAIGAVARGGGPLPGPGRRRSGPIPADHADAGLGLQPEGPGLGLTIGQAGERAPPFASAQHGPISLALALGPSVDAEPVGCAHTAEG